MARVEGYINEEKVYDKECLQLEVDYYIEKAFNSWGSIDECGEVKVEVTNDDGYVWCP